MKDKAAIYLRLSKEDLDKGENVSESIRNQKAMLCDFARERGWEIYDIYSDEDYSGAYAGDDNDRPAFNRLIKDAEKNCFNIVLCKSQSRFSRNMEVIEQYLHGAFVEWGVRFVGVVDNTDTSVRGNKKARQIYGMTNEWYVEELSENVRAVFEMKMKNGEYLAAFPPYGYSRDTRKKNHLAINPVTAPVVKQIFAWHSEGYGTSKISRMLNERGIPCPRKQQEIDGFRKTLMYAEDDMGKWSAATVGDILHNQAYCGDVVQHTVEKVSYKSRRRKRLDSGEWIVVRDMHEPIISREIFEETKARLGMRRKASGIGKVHILSGKVFCHSCGKAMQKNSSTGGSQYLRCRDKYSYPSELRCDTPNIRIDTVLAALETDFIERCKQTAIEKYDEKTLKAMLAGNSGASLLKNEYERLKKEYEQLTRRQKTLYSDRLSEVITVEEYLSWRDEILRKKNVVMERIREIENKPDFQEDGRKDIEELSKAVFEYLREKEIDRSIIDRLVDRIEFGEKDSETGERILKIYWAWG